MRPVIQCEKLTHFYGSRQVFSSLDFEIQTGEIVGLLGKNGVGKTTLIKILNGFLPATSGQCLIWDTPVDELMPTLRQRVAYLMEGHIQYSFMTIRQLEKFYAPFYPKWRKDAFFELMGLMDVKENQKVGEMSYGQRSQVALGLLLAQDPDLLILDDFSMGLDPGYRRLFVAYLREYVKTRKKTVLVTTHIIQDMERLIDRVMILDKGGIIIDRELPDLIGNIKCFSIPFYDGDLKAIEGGPVFRLERTGSSWDLFSFEDRTVIENHLDKQGLKLGPLVEQTALNLEELFIGITGKY